MNILLLPQNADCKTDFVVQNSLQVQHVIQVLKLTVGDTLRIGISQGKLGTAVIASIDDNQNRIVLTDIHCHQTPPQKLELSVLLALPRPKVLRRLIIDMTAIGVKNIVLLNSYRTHKSYWQSPMLNRMDEFVREGLQQGVDTVAPVISLQKRFKPFVEDELSVLTRTQQAVIAHPYATQSFNAYATAHSLPQIIGIGAEGGWIDYEINLFAANGCHTANIGHRILRTEAVVNALCGRYL